MAPIPRPPQINPESPEMYEDVENKQAYYERTHNGTKKKKWIIIGSIITTLLLIIAVSIAVPLSMKNNATAEAKINLPKKSANPSKNISGSRGQLGDMVLAQPVENVVMQNILITPPGSDGPFIQPPYAHEVSPYSNMTRLKVFTPANSVKRVFVMGDIHGCLKEMNQLLELVKFQPGSDVLVLSGDLVFKGEDSLGVIRRARELGALCVRGNHDDKVVRLKTFIDRFGVDAMIQEDNIMPEGKVGDPLRLGNRHVNLAKKINQDEFNYLLECPLILEIPSLKARIVHGGIDPAISNVVNNDPWSVMNMRDMDEKDYPTALKISKKKATKFPLYKHWTSVYNNKPLQDDMTIYYGHDASRGVNFKNRTVGLDSGCIYGKQLSTVEIKSGQLFQVECTGLYYSEHDD